MSEEGSPLPQHGRGSAVALQASGCALLGLLLGFNPDVQIRSPTMKRLADSVSGSQRQRDLANKRGGDV